MLFRLICTTIILGTIVGFANLSKGAFFRTLGGQIIHGVVSIACLVLVVIAFWCFGWKIGILDVFLAIIAAHVGFVL